MGGGPCASLMARARMADKSHKGRARGARLTSEGRRLAALQGRATRTPDGAGTCPSRPFDDRAAELADVGGAASRRPSGARPHGRRPARAPGVPVRAARRMRLSVDAALGGRRAALEGARDARPPMGREPARPRRSITPARGSRRGRLPPAPCRLRGRGRPSRSARARTGPRPSPDVRPARANGRR